MYDEKDKKKSINFENIADTDIMLYNNRLCDIIVKASERVPGFVNFSENFFDKINYAINTEKIYSGIILDNKIDENGENILDIGLSIVIEYSVNILDICYNIKSSVIKEIKMYAGINVSNVDIYVSAIENKNNKRD